MKAKTFIEQLAIVLPLSECHTVIETVIEKLAIVQF